MVLLPTLAYKTLKLRAYITETLSLQSTTQHIRVLSNSSTQIKCFYVFSSVPPGLGSGQFV